MSVKKSLVLSAAGIAAVGMTTAMAGGPDMMVAPAAFQPAAYIEAHLGYVMNNYRRFAFSPFLTFGDNTRGAFAAGGDIGYQFLRNLAIEVGGFWLNEAKGTSRFVNQGQALSVTNWFVYGAFKITVPIWDSFDMFGKIGVFYRQQRFRGAFESNSGYWRPLFAVGMSYTYAQSWIFGVQYMYLMTYGRLNGPISRRAPAASLFTGSIGYMFSV